MSSSRRRSIAAAVDQGAERAENHQINEYLIGILLSILLRGMARHQQSFLGVDHAFCRNSHAVGKQSLTIAHSIDCGRYIAAARKGHGAGDPRELVLDQAVQNPQSGLFARIVHGKPLHDGKVLRNARDTGFILPEESGIIRQQEATLAGFDDLGARGNLVDRRDHLVGMFHPGIGRLGPMFRRQRHENLSADDCCRSSAQAKRRQQPYRARGFRAADLDRRPV